MPDLSNRLDAPSGPPGEIRELSKREMEDVSGGTTRVALSGRLGTRNQGYFGMNTFSNEFETEGEVLK